MNMILTTGTRANNTMSYTERAQVKIFEYRVASDDVCGRQKSPADRRCVRGAAGSAAGR